jgi:hypothetical protein
MSFSSHISYANQGQQSALMASANIEFRSVCDWLVSETCAIDI